MNYIVDPFVFLTVICVLFEYDMHRNVLAEFRCNLEFVHDSFSPKLYVTLLAFFCSVVARHGWL